MGLVFIFVISRDADFHALGFISLALFLVLFHVEGGFGEEPQAYHTSAESGEPLWDHWGVWLLVTWVRICFQIQSTVPAWYEHKELVVIYWHTCRGLNSLVFLLQFLCVCL